MLSSEILCREGYKMFRGEMRITPKNPNFKLFILNTVWLYKPDTKCWYGNDSSYIEEICEIVED